MTFTLADRADTLPTAPFSPANRRAADAALVTSKTMSLTFFERFGLLTILIVVLSVGGLLFFEHERDARKTQGFLTAVEKGDEAEVKRMLDEGANPNAVTTRLVNKPSVGNLLLCTLPDAVRKHAAPKTTALMLAVMSKHGYMISLLLEKGAEVNAADEYGCTALTLAISEDRLDMAQQLLEHGANPNLPNASLVPMLNWAIMLREGPVVHALLDKGADANAEDGMGMSALYLAGVDDDLPVARLLLDHGAKPNTTHKGWSALRLMVEQDNADFARLLIERGANRDEKLPDGRSLLQLAIDDKRVHIVPILKEAAQAAPRQITG